jgi:hypothetical protein
MPAPRGSRKIAFSDNLSSRHDEVSVVSCDVKMAMCSCNARQLG